jgi:hypothetical protein
MKEMVQCKADKKYNVRKVKTDVDKCDKKNVDSNELGQHRAE